MGEYIGHSIHLSITVFPRVNDQGVCEQVKAKQGDALNSEHGRFLAKK